MSIHARSDELDVGRHGVEPRSVCRVEDPELRGDDTRKATALLVPVHRGWAQTT